MSEIGRIEDTVIFDALCKNDPSLLGISPEFMGVKNQYVVYHKQIERRMDGSSGGVYGALMETVTKEGYFFTGTVYDEELKVHHEITNDPERIVSFMGYKPLNSDCQEVFQKIKELLANGEKVLYCGTSFQCFLLLKYVDNQENLVTVDIIHSGFVTDELLRKYADDFEKKYSSKVVDIRFHNKEFADDGSKRISFENGRVVYTHKSDEFDSLVRSGKFVEKTKLQDFSDINRRVADITIGAYSMTSPDNDGLGYAYISINSEKGADLFSKTKKRLVIVKEGNEIETSRIKYQTYKSTDFIDINGLNSKSLKELLPQRSISGLSKLKRILGILRSGLRFSQYNLGVFSSFIKLNFFSKGVITDIANEGIIYIAPYCAFKFVKGSQIVLHGPLFVGVKRIKSSRLETRIRMEKGAKMIVHEGGAFGSGSNIEIYKDALLEIGDLRSNAELTIICGEHISIGSPNNIARNATIRDTSGHLIATPGYHQSKPVIIGNHVWVCTESVVMPGVSIGDGSIIGANSFVTKKVPPFTIVQGNPAVEVGKVKYFRI